ncbi:MAG: hypothetical protein ACFB4J_08440 [Elainellaceae cyanobacterium]
MSVNSPQRYLVLDVQGSNTAIKPGETTVVERELILHNRSAQTVHVDLWVDPNDAKALPLRQWCQFSNPNPTVEPGGEQRVQLRFEIPTQAEPGFYSYDVCAQTPELQGDIERRSQQLEVLTSDQAITLRNEPAFFLTPPTSSEQPYRLQAGSTFTIRITVENRSKRVDRLFLTCPELPEDWFEVAYPEAETDTPGRVVQTDGLQLNPDATGIITLQLHPPGLTPAGHYSTTLRLASANQANLVLLDILYFTIGINDQLKLALSPQVGHVPGADSEFAVLVQNLGNVGRDVMAIAYDSDRLFRYIISPNPISLAPGATAQVLVQPAARKWWRRQWKKRQEVAFTVEVDNFSRDRGARDGAIRDGAEPTTASALVQRDTAAVTAPPLKLPNPLEGKIVWESRPSWLRWLLIGLLATGLLAGAILLAYWLVRKLVVEPSLEPRILAFSTPSESYVADEASPIQLDWEVSNADWKDSPIEQEGSPEERLSGATLTFFSRETKAELPLQLTPAWFMAQEECSRETRPVRPVMRLLYGLYGKATETTVLVCQGVQIQPPEQTVPEADGFAFTVGAYDVTLALLTPKASPSEKIDEAGTASESENLKQSDTRTLRSIQLTPAPPPEILYFYSKAQTYREGAIAPEGSGPDADGPETASSARPSDPPDKYPAAPVTLTWIIDRPREIEALELSAIAVTSDGTVESDRVSYEIPEGSSDNIPLGLEAQCRPDDGKLICEDVPVPAAETAGEYTFTLTVVMPDPPERDDISQEAEPVTVLPPLPKILEFTLNGKPAADHPQQVYLVNPDRGSVDVTLAWAVAEPERMQVELLPAPGLVDSSTTQMPFSLSPTPGNTNLTLQVTNAVGEVASRSVTIATAAPRRTTQPVLPVPTAPPSGIPQPPPPNVLPRSELEPIQVPPSGN